MIVRPATADDKEVLFTLYVTGWQQAYQGIIDDAYLTALPTHNPTHDFIARLLSNTRDDLIILLAEEDERLMGFIAAGHSRDVTNSKQAEIYAIYVAPTAQGKSVGRQLLDECCKELRQKAFTNVHVWTFAENHKAQKAYRHWGATETNTRRTVIIAGKTVDEVGFNWSLD